MQYRYVTEQQDYSDFSSGRVFYSLPGHPAFPVRLASEIFQRCVASREKIYGNSSPCILYDPCCGAAYHLSVLACLHGEMIQEVFGSDIDGKAVDVAGRNLGLLSVGGMERRVGELARLLELYHKDSHKEALVSAHLLQDKIAALNSGCTIPARAFQANAANAGEINKNIKTGTVDIVFTDIPYGQHSRWQGFDFETPLNPVWKMLDALTGILSSSSIVAIVSDKQQKILHERFHRVEQFQAGKRRIVILKPA